MQTTLTVASRIASILTLGWSDRPNGRSRLRRMASWAARAAMRARCRPFRGESFRSVIVLAPHPDDEALGCGGTLALLGSMGSSVHIIFLTDGRASHPGHALVSPEKLLEMRKFEAKEAVSALQIDWNRVIFVDAIDGSLARLGTPDAEKVVTKLTAAFLRIAPDAVLLPCRRDGSSDHEASFTLVQLALRKSGRNARVLEFPVWAWRNPLRLVNPILTSRTVWRSDIRDTCGQKAKAVDAYASQTRPIPPDILPMLPQDFVAEFAFQEEFFFEK